MRCTHPNHNRDKACTKEFSVRQAGGSDQAQRLLKAWIIFGAEITTSKDDHHNTWSEVKSLKELPSDADLDAMAPMDWIDYSSDVALEDSCCGDVGPSRRVGKKVPIDDTPPDLQAAAEALMVSGELPRTTPAQRARNRMCAGINYRTPERYTRLFRFGFLGPNLPPPENFRWHCRCGVWLLLPRGG